MTYRIVKVANTDSQTIDCPFRFNVEELRLHWWGFRWKKVAWEYSQKQAEMHIMARRKEVEAKFVAKNRPKFKPEIVATFI